MSCGGVISTVVFTVYVFTVYIGHVLGSTDFFFLSTVTGEVGSGFDHQEDKGRRALPPRSRISGGEDEVVLTLEERTQRR